MCSRGCPTEGQMAPFFDQKCQTTIATWAELIYKQDQPIKPYDCTRKSMKWTKKWTTKWTKKLFIHYLQGRGRVRGLEPLGGWLCSVISRTQQLYCRRVYSLEARGATGGRVFCDYWDAVFTGVYIRRRLRYVERSDALAFLFYCLTLWPIK
ncbi:hypothetical protein BaRGS_00029940 [Batillaria attramentaria]|uniref:Uncharacterized protein n=1 Tax=Batillaria attramentaria TaxID=370345 RepID=A0ABD0JVX1_9CAEN